MTNCWILLGKKRRIWHKENLTNIYPLDLTAILASRPCRLPKDRRRKTADRRKTALSAVNRPEIADFRDTHDAVDYDDQTHKVEMEFDLQSRRHYIAIDPDLLSRLRQVARSRGISLESLANLWLQKRALAVKN
ncbi:MAG: hypothetical protein B6243_10680 [Anaerolineaceae bacterium 4572_5.2]|nr:MAG: hypothetical protein B6243_10680 [Anaerolineaceae bacterium 4572_5.2]